MKRYAAALLVCSGISSVAHATDTVRFATFNASLNRDSAGQLLSDLSNPNANGVSASVANRIQQAHNVAEIIQRVRPDVLLVNEFDFDQAGTPGSSSTPSALGYTSSAAQLFSTNFLSAAHGGGSTGRTVTDAIAYDYGYTPTTNTGIPSGIDLDNSGGVGGGNDAYGFGNFAGQYGFTVYSRYEITNVRTFQNFLWKDMTGNLLTQDTDSANDLINYYSPEAIDALRLSSKNHVDVTLNIDGREVHFLTAHPTPPVFDGAEDRNGKRNHDEIRFWADYIAGGADADYIYDDQGGTGGLDAGSLFVIAGDYNADPLDGDSVAAAINQLLEHPLVNVSLTPDSAGGIAAATDPSNNGTANQSHLADPRYDTADFNDAAPGNLRVDYVLPSANTDIVDGGVFWPAPDDENFGLVGTFGNPGLYAGFPTSDHKAVYVDVVLPAAVPVPAALPLLGCALVGLFGLQRRRSTRQ